MTEIIFKSNYTKDGKFLLSNFYGGSEIDYMLPKFINDPKVYKMVRDWKYIKSNEELNRWRTYLAKKRVVIDSDGIRTLVLKGAPYTKKTYTAEYNGKSYLGVGILAKLAANSWNNKIRRNVIEFLADIPHDSMTPPLNLYERTTDEGRNIREINMKRALFEKFRNEPYRSYLVSTENAKLGEAGNDMDFGIKGENLLGKWLMELRQNIISLRNFCKNPSSQSLNGIHSKTREYLILISNYCHKYNTGNLRLASIILPLKSLYFERQVESLCTLHAVNNAAGFKLIECSEMKEFKIDSGKYDIEDVQRVVNKSLVKIVPLWSINKENSRGKKDILNLEFIKTDNVIISWSKPYWHRVALRLFNGEWWLLDSEMKKPKKLEDIKLLHKKRTEWGIETMYTVVEKDRVLFDHQLSRIGSKDEPINLS
jgi:hypothetical protein